MNDNPYQADADIEPLEQQRPPPRRYPFEAGMMLAALSLFVLGYAYFTMGFFGGEGALWGVISSVLLTGALALAAWAFYRVRVKQRQTP